MIGINWFSTFHTEREKLNYNFRLYLHNEHFRLVCCSRLDNFTHLKIKKKQ